MLIEFSVKNYRSFKESQTISLVASNYDHNLEDTNCFNPGVTGIKKLLRSAALYGPNASGKSNIVKSMRFMQYFVKNSHAQQESSPIETEPFLFSSQTLKEPSEFEFIFIQDDVRYQYGFAVNKERVYDEWLIAFPDGKPQRWFKRSYIGSTGKEQWQFGSKLKGRKQIWQEATRKNALFLSTAVQLNSEQLRPVFNWFKERLVVLTSELQIHPDFTSEQLTTETSKKRILDFMLAADSSIKNIEVRKTPFTTDMLPSDLPQTIRDEIIQNMKDKEIKQTLFYHQGDENALPLKFEKESAGTRKMYSYAGPWLDVLNSGSVLWVDELETNLHSLLVKHLVNLIHNPRDNKKDAQLIMTTHNTTILNTDVFRRDQVWFTQKNQENSSTLYPLSDFNPRKGEILEKNYFHGRYGALPLIYGTDDH